MVCEPFQIIQLESTIEDNVEELYGPNGKPSQKGYMEALEEMLTSNDLRLPKNVRLMITTIEESSMSIDTFVEVIKVLYPKFSTPAKYKMRGYPIKLPTYEEIEKINRILDFAGITVHPDYTFTLQPSSFYESIINFSSLI